MFAAKNCLFTVPKIVSPTYDNSTPSTFQSGVASGTAFTFSHTATAGAYAIVAVYSSGSAYTGSPVTTAATPTVTFGGTTMTGLGPVLIGGAAANGFIWVFGVNTVSGGSDTVSVKFTQSSKVFYGYAAAFTYTGVSSVGTLTTASGSSASPSVSVTSTTGDMVWGTLANYKNSTTTASTYTAFALTQRQSWSTTTAYPFMVAGDTAGAATVTVSGTQTTTETWGAVGLNIR